MSIQTVSLETARLLKKSGFRQETEFYWHDRKIIDRLDREPIEPFITQEKQALKRNWLIDDIFSAPTTDELLAVLPEDLYDGEYRCTLTIQKNTEAFNVYYHHPSLSFRDTNFESLSLPEALASMYLWLAKENLLPLKESRKT